MADIIASVVICTYNRAHLLWRSLETYTRQTEKRFELIILDDGSSDSTEQLVQSYSDRLRIRYQKLQDKKPGEWRDAGAIINRGILISEGAFVLITHPEVMLCFDCIEKAAATLRDHPDIYFNSRVYFMTSFMQEHIDTVDWKGDFYAIRKLPTFYDNPEPLYKEEFLGTIVNQCCTPAVAESCEIWDSWVFGGMTRKAWKKFGGLNESPHWGTVDYDFMQRRHLTGWKTLSPNDVFVIHQNHDKPTGHFVPTVRDFGSMLQDSLVKFTKKRNFLKDMKV